MDPEFQCLVSFVLGGGVWQNDHKFRFPGDIKLYERPLTYIFLQREKTVSAFES